MKGTYNVMNTNISNRLDGLDRLLEDLYAELKTHSADALNRRPGSGQWSVMQVMQHLLLSEHLSEKYVQKKLSFNPQLPNAGFAGAFRIFLLRLNIALPFKFKAPKAVGDEALPENSSLEETMTRWRANRAGLRAYLAGLPEEYFKKSIYRHPFAGRLSLSQMLLFFELHFRRHVKQIKRTL
jgi:hypothetical protein